jgi:hypothetical protein
VSYAFRDPSPSRFTESQRLWPMMRWSSSSILSRQVVPAGAERVCAHGRILPSHVTAAVGTRRQSGAGSPSRLGRCSDAAKFLHDRNVTIPVARTHARLTHGGEVMTQRSSRLAEPALAILTATGRASGPARRPRSPTLTLIRNCHAAASSPADAAATLRRVFWGARLKTRQHPAGARTPPPGSSARPAAREITRTVES